MIMFPIENHSIKEINAFKKEAKFHTIAGGKRMSEITVRKFKLADLGAVKQIARGLHPEWFTEEALVNIPRDIQFSKCFVAELEHQVVGFVSVISHDGRPMIGWLGTEKRLRGKRIGKKLVERVVAELKSFGYRELRVQTVGECQPVYEPYEMTLKFYESMGFKVEKRGRLREDLGYKWRFSTLRKSLK
jgi:GNAT superfamily N-acetyltransferase